MDRILQKMGMVFQQFNLFADHTILESIIVSPIRLLDTQGRGPGCRS